MHRPCLLVFGNSDHVWAMFRSTMVTSYPGQSSLPWPGELVIGSTIMYRKGVKIDKSVVIRWAYIKELAMINTREGNRDHLVVHQGKHSKGWEKKSVYGQGIRGKM